MSWHRLLLRYARPYRAGWAVIAALTAISAGAAILQPWPMQLLVDHVLGHAAPPAWLARAWDRLPGGGSAGGQVAWIAAAGVAALALDTIAEMALSVAWIRFGQRMVHDLSGDVFDQLQRRAVGLHGERRVGDLVSRVAGDSWCVHTVFAALVFTPLQALLVAGGMLILMARMDAGLALAAAAVAPLMAAAMAGFAGPLRAAGRVERDVEGRIHAHVHQALSGIAAVQAFGREEREHRRFRALGREAVRAHQRSALFGGYSGLTSGLAAAAGTAAILWLGARRVLVGELTIGGLLVFLAYLTALQEQLRRLADAYRDLQGVTGSAERVAEVLTAEPAVRERPAAVVLPRARGHVRLEAVTFGYAEGRPVLRDVTLEARPGETVALVGATGAGKSTLAALLPRFFDPWSGRVLLDGTDLRDARLASVRAQVALVLQEPLLLPLTVAENIAYGRPAATRGEVVAAARAACADEFIARLPDGYDEVLGEWGATLSGGQRQRLAIARALLKDAPVLVLDEPTSALDAETEGLLLGALARLTAGRTTFVIAHRLSTIRSADRIAVLEHGRIAEEGTHAQLMARGGPYRRLHDLQFASGADVA